MTRHLDRIAGVWDAISSAEGFEEVGFCLDTCHAWAGGIELATAVEKVRSITGRIDLVHANDSRDAFDSGADRHANFGAGQLDADDFAARRTRRRRAGRLRDPGRPRASTGPTSRGCASTASDRLAPQPSSGPAPRRPSPRAAAAPTASTPAEPRPSASGTATSPASSPTCACPTATRWARSCCCTAAIGGPATTSTSSTRSPTC